MNTFKVLLIQTLLAANWVFCPLGFAGAFANGSFELPGGFAHNTGIALATGATLLTGWTIGGGGDSYITLVEGTIPSAGLDFSAVDGSYQISFDSGSGANHAWISQTFDTVVGEDYVVTFSVGQRGTGERLSLGALVRSAEGTLLAQFVATPPAHGYGKRESFTFTATSSTTTLQLLDTSIDRVGVALVLDNVTVAVRQPTVTIGVSQVQICWDSLSGRVYQVQYRSTATTNLWVNLGAPVLGTGGSVCVVDSTAGQPRRFYQVVKQP